MKKSGGRYHDGAFTPIIKERKQAKTNSPRKKKNDALQGPQARTCYELVSDPPAVCPSTVGRLVQNSQAELAFQLVARRAGATATTTSTGKGANSSNRRDSGTNVTKSPGNPGVASTRAYSHKPYCHE